MMRNTIFILFAIVALSSCSEGVSKTYTIENIELIAEGPLFDGPNTMQATHVIDLNQLEAGLAAENIEAVKLTKATVSNTEGDSFNNIRNFVLQLTSADAKMEKAGVLNPIPKDTPTVELTPAAEAELTDNFKQKELILVLDADLEGDREESLAFKGTFEFEITYKK